MKDVAGYFLFGLSLLMLCRSLTLCFSDDIWYDELFTVGMIRHSYGEFITFTARDVHPPLYYCIVKFVVELCKLIAPAADVVAVAKIVSVLPYFVLAAYSVTLIRRRFGALAGGLFLFCVISMPQLSAYTVEVRMYSWALLFVTAAFLHAHEIAARCGDGAVRDASETAGQTGRKRAPRGHAAALILYGLAAAYTQYFAGVAAAMVYLYVLAVFLRKDRRRVREWLLWTALSVIGYAPWLAALAGQLAAVQENYWIQPVSWRTLGGCVKFLMKPSFANETAALVLAVALFLSYVAVICAALAKLCHNGRVLDAGFIVAGAGVLAGLALFGIAASVVFRPVFVYRYMIPAAGCFWLAFAAAAGVLAEQDTARFGRWASMAVCALFLLVGLRDYRAFMGEEEYRALLMKDTEAALSQIGDDDILIFNFDQVQMVMGYYVNNESYLWYGQPESLIQEICGQKGVLHEDTGQIRDWLSQGRNVWFVGSFNNREDIVSLWRSQGIAVAEPTDHLLERYWFNLYRLSAE